MRPSPAGRNGPRAGPSSNRSRPVPRPERRTALVQARHSRLAPGDVLRPADRRADARSRGPSARARARTPPPTTTFGGFVQDRQRTRTSPGKFLSTVLNSKTAHVSWPTTGADRRLITPTSSTNGHRFDLSVSNGALMIPTTLDRWWHPHRTPLDCPARPARSSTPWDRARVGTGTSCTSSPGPDRSVRPRPARAGPLRTSRTFASTPARGALVAPLSRPPCSFPRI